MSTNNLNVNSDIEVDNTDDDLDSLLAESLLEVEKKKALKKIARDKINSRLLTEDQKELLQQEENLKWVDGQELIMYLELQICLNCRNTHTELRGFYKSQSRINSSETKRLVKVDINEPLSQNFKKFRIEKQIPICAYCADNSPKTIEFITLNELPILKGLL